MITAEASRQIVVSKKVLIIKTGDGSCLDASFASRVEGAGTVVRIISNLYAKTDSLLTAPRYN
jgi:hypothetical protein